MEKRIELEKRGRKSNQITELNLDNCRSTSIVGLTDEFTALESLSLINVGLTTLKGFPKLPNLKKLELSDNRISNGLNHLTTSPKLTHLTLSGNKIKDLEALKPLESFENLEALDLFINEVTSTENYREKIFQMIPSLKYLDGFDANEVEASSEGDDDDEVNGNESDDDENTVFSINGLEIDLIELEKLEKAVENKRGCNTVALNCDIKDDLDEYLEKLKIKENEESEKEEKLITKISSFENSNNIDTLSIIKCDDAVLLQDPIKNTQPNATSLPLLMYAFMAILSFVSLVRFSDEMVGDEDDGDDDDDDDDDESEEEDNGDLSLAEVYNDELEEDNSEWDEDVEGEEEVDDDDTDEEEGDEAANQKEAETPEESQARGKKRKHDG